MRLFRAPILGIFAMMLFVISCKKSDIALPKSEANIDSIASKYYEGYLKMFPLEATMQGDNRYNDQLPNAISQDFISKEIGFYTETQKKLQNLDYESLSDKDKTVYDVLSGGAENIVLGGRSMVSRAYISRFNFAAIALRSSG